MGLLKRTAKLIAWLITGAVVLAVVAGTAVAGVFAWKGYNMYCDAVEQTPVADKIASIQQTEGYVYYDELPAIYIDAVDLGRGQAVFSAMAGLIRWRLFVRRSTTCGRCRLSKGAARSPSRSRKTNISPRKKRWNGNLPRYLSRLIWRRPAPRKRFSRCMSIPSILGSGVIMEFARRRWGYYGVEPSELTDWQSVMLAGAAQCTVSLFS